MQAIAQYEYGSPDVLRLEEIDRTYPLHEAPDAIRYLAEGHARGKVVIAVPG
jgi:hypothetical protein